MIKFNSRVVCWKVKNIDKDFELLEDEYSKEFLDEIKDIITEIKVMHDNIDIDDTNINVNLDKCEVFYLAEDQGTNFEYTHQIKNCKAKVIIHDRPKN